MTTKILSFEDVIVDQGVNPRETMDYEAIEEYAANVDDLPPMTVFEIEGAGYVLTRGFHRIEAHKRAGRREAKFNIKSGAIEDAKRDADTDNLTHGVRMTHRERRGVYERELRRNPQRYDTEIARVCKTTPERIKAVRQQMEAANLIGPVFDLFGEHNGNGQKTGIPVDPAQYEREWFKHRWERRKTTIDERKRPCEACAWVLTQRAHLLDAAAWGDSPENPERALCARCHETYDIIINAREKEHERAVEFLEVFLKAHAANPLAGFDYLLALADQMLKVRANLKAIKERRNGY